MNMLHRPHEFKYLFLSSYDQWSATPSPSPLNDKLPISTPSTFSNPRPTTITNMLLYSHEYGVLTHEFLPSLSLKIIKWCYFFKSGKLSSIDHNFDTKSSM